MSGLGTPAAASVSTSGIHVRAITGGTAGTHHTAGYYDKCPWDSTGRYVLALRSAFFERAPAAEDAAVLGVVDVQEGNRFTPFAETRAWNWQQGCMLHWLSAPLAFSPQPDEDDPARHQVIYNDRDGDRFVAVVADALTGREVRRLPLPVYGLSPDGRQAVTLNFARLHHQRPGYGYAGVDDPWRDVAEPEDDGIWWMDLDTAEHRLILSTAQLAQTNRQSSMAGAVHRFNHLQWNPDGTRFAFLHRWKTAENTGPGTTRLGTASPDGSGLAVLADEGRVSHYDWRDRSHVLAWARRGGEDAFYVLHDPTGEAARVDPVAMPKDGHCSYSPEGARRWIVNDTYPDAEQKRTLYLYDTAARHRTDLGHFYAPPHLPHDCRVDLHPRWSRDGQQVCFDSAHEGTRQLYVAEVSTATGT